MTNELNLQLRKSNSIVCMQSESRLQLGVQAYSRILWEDSQQATIYRVCKRHAIGSGRR